MKKAKEISKLIREGKVIITTPEMIEEAVREAVQLLYKDNEEFDKNRYKTEREFEPLEKEDFKQISFDVIEYLTGN